MSAFDGSRQYGTHEGGQPAYSTTVRLGATAEASATARGGAAAAATNRRCISDGPPRPLHAQADVGMKGNGGGGGQGDKLPGGGAQGFVFMQSQQQQHLHDKAPAPLQLERIEEDATLQGAAAACLPACCMCACVHAGA